MEYKYIKGVYVVYDTNILPPHVNTDVVTGSPPWQLRGRNPELEAGWEAGAALIIIVTISAKQSFAYKHHHQQPKRVKVLENSDGELVDKLDHQDELDEQPAQRGRGVARDPGKHQVRHRLSGGRHELLLHRRCKPGTSMDIQ